MCGLFFSESTLLTSPQIIAVKNHLKHRGPDGEGYFEDESIGITAIHSRLAIQDIDSRSNQPFFSQDGKSFIIYNGEIFNKVELSQSLRDKVELHTTSDTEVLIEMIRIFGLDATLNRINGMFAFIYVDLHENTIVAARDQFGIKPLYFYVHPSLGMLFSSEIEALQSLTNLTLNHPILREFIYFGLVDHSDETFYEKVMRLRAGSLMERRDGKWTNRNWLFDPIDKTLPKLKYADYLDKLDYLLGDVMRSSTIADCSIALNLSSGVDSQLIYRYLAPFQSQMQLHTVSWEDSQYSESGLVKNSLRAGDLLQEHIFTARQVWELVQKSFEIQNEPYTSPFVAVWGEVYRRIHDTGVKVVLDGSGADEIFFGYSKYQSWTSQEFWRFNIDGSYNEIAFEPRIRYSPKSLLESNILDIKFLKLPRSLRFIDKASMANSVETRVPYLSRDIWVTARSVPVEWHIDSNHTKKSLRACLQKNSGSNPFASKWNTQFPLQEWMKTSWRDPLNALFSDPNKISLLDTWQYEPHPLTKALAQLDTNTKTNNNFVWRMAIATLWINSKIFL